MGTLLGEGGLKAVGAAPALPARFADRPVPMTPVKHGTECQVKGWVCEVSVHEQCQPSCSWIFLLISSADVPGGKATTSTDFDSGVLVLDPGATPNVRRTSTNAWLSK